MTMNVDTTPALADGNADGSLGTPLLDDRREGNGLTAADLPHKDQCSRRKRDKQTQDVAPGTSSMVPAPPDWQS